MDFAQQQRNPKKHLIGIALVIAFHAILVWALVNGLAIKVVEVVKAPFETKLIQESAKVAHEDTPPPPPPKLTIPPPPFIPPPEIIIAEAPPAPVIATTTAAPQSAKIDTRHTCEEPEYPAASRRAGEVGTVTLRFLIDVNGRVIDSKIETSSGFPRLDRAARASLSQCIFKPVVVEGKPEQAWALIRYKWRLQ